MCNVCVCYPSLSVTLYHTKMGMLEIKKNLLTKSLKHYQ